MRLLASPRSIVKLHCWLVGVRRTGSKPPGLLIPQAGGGGAPGVPHVRGSGALLKRSEREQRTAQLLARTKWRIVIGPVPEDILEIVVDPKPARTAHVPLPVGSHAM